MAEQRKNNLLAVLVAAYLPALLIEKSGLSIQYIFWLYCLVYFSMILYCHGKCGILKVYAVVNYVMLSALFPLIFADYPLIILVLWDANLSLSDIMLSYELAMLMFGGWCAAMAIYNGTVDVDSRGSAGRTHNNQGSKA